MNHIKTCVGLLCMIVLVLPKLQAQYFGKNKPRYQNFDFEVYKTPTFDIYHYIKDKDNLNALVQQSEQWYKMHQSVLQDTFKSKNPIIFYNDHAAFQQTNTISGSIGVGTGGVTEAFKNRVIMPLAMSNEQTNHVLGHELVHAFQYNMIIRGDSTSLKSLKNLPLWMVEGLAEYMSIGRVDGHTAMWMRDAVLQDDVPAIKKLSNYSEYFPYRYGHAFWAFLTGTYGDDIIQPFFTATAKYGMDTAIRMVLNTNQKTLSGMWQSALKTYYDPMLGDKKEQKFGKVLFDKKNSGKLNIAPVLSPNGRYVIFLSERDLFSTDLFLADARNGKIIRKVASTTKSGHLDDFSYIESAGTWSPNSKEFAFVAFKKGKNVLVIKDVDSGKTIKELFMPDVPAFNNPTWSPDGKQIVVVGLVDGQSDLFAYHLKEEKTTRLTNNKYSEIHPDWSADGKHLLYSTDQLSRQNGRTHGKWVFNMATLDIASKEIHNINVFPGADNLNPIYDQEGNILFLSNRDGFRNLYKYEPATGKIYQQTDLLTGISGITPYAPAISTSKKRDRILYTYYADNSYTIFTARPTAFMNKEVKPDEVDFAAATLPVVGLEVKDIVNTNLRQIDKMDQVDDQSFTSEAYRPKFKLDYIGGGAGVGVGNRFGNTNTGMAGGVDMLFSDMLGNNQLFTALSLNGEIYDFGGQVGYINRKNKIFWGASLSHIPYQTGSLTYGGTQSFPVGNDQSILADKFTLDLLRIFQDRASLFAQYPISKTLRVEAGGALTRYSYRLEQIHNYYSFNSLIFQEREKLDAPKGFNLYSANAALVGDNSKFGLASPMAGYRYRLGVERYMGQWDFFATTADFRKYHYFKPFSLGFRAMHYARYGQGARQLPSIYIGEPTLVRGYNFRSFSQLQENGIDINRLTGSKLLVSNFEIRLPFTGPERLAMIKSKFLFTELALFVDGGVAWNNYSDFRGGESGSALKPLPVFSTGISGRINVFGALILEPYFAFPIQKNTRGVFGLNIVPGW